MDARSGSRVRASAHTLQSNIRHRVMRADAAPHLESAAWLEGPSWRRAIGCAVHPGNGPSPRLQLRPSASSLRIVNAVTSGHSGTSRCSFSAFARYPWGRSAATEGHMAGSGIEAKRRKAALKHASEAHWVLTALQHNWRLMSVTRPAARELDPIIATALKAVTTLTDTTADHWGAAVLLMSVVEALDLIAQPGSDTSREEAQRALARDEAHRAYQEIAANRASSGRRGRN